MRLSPSERVRNALGSIEGMIDNIPYDNEDLREKFSGCLLGVLGEIYRGGSDTGKFVEEFRRARRAFLANTDAHPDRGGDGSDLAVMNATFNEVQSYLNDSDFRPIWDPIAASRIATKAALLNAQAKEQSLKRDVYPIEVGEVLKFPSERMEFKSMLLNIGKETVKLHCSDSSVTLIDGNSKINITAAHPIELGRCKVLANEQGDLIVSNHGGEDVVLEITPGIEEIFNLGSDAFPDINDSYAFTSCAFDISPEDAIFFNLDQPDRLEAGEVKIGSFKVKFSLVNNAFRIFTASGEEKVLRDGRPKKFARTGAQIGMFNGYLVVVNAGQDTLNCEISGEAEEKVDTLEMVDKEPIALDKYARIELGERRIIAKLRPGQCYEAVLESGTTTVGGNCFTTHLGEMSGMTGRARILGEKKWRLDNDLILEWERDVNSSVRIWLYNATEDDIFFIFSRELKDGGAATVVLDNDYLSSLKNGTWAKTPDHKPIPSLLGGDEESVTGSKDGVTKELNSKRSEQPRKRERRAQDHWNVTPDMSVDSVGRLPLGDIMMVGVPKSNRRFFGSILGRSKLKVPESNQSQTVNFGTVKAINFPTFGYSNHFNVSRPTGDNQVVAIEGNGTVSVDGVVLSPGVFVDISGIEYGMKIMPNGGRSFLYIRHAHDSRYKTPIRIS